MIAKRPAVLIYVCEPDPNSLRNLCAGVEEEGVLYEVQMRDAGPADQLADDAARDSVLGSGLGLIGRTAALQLRDCPKGRPVFHMEQVSPTDCRSLGADSARAIKKLPFKTGEGKGI